MATFRFTVAHTNIANNRFNMAHASIANSRCTRAYRIIAAQYTSGQRRRHHRAPKGGPPRHPRFSRTCVRCDQACCEDRHFRPRCLRGGREGPRRLCPEVATDSGQVNSSLSSRLYASYIECGNETKLLTRHNRRATIDACCATIALRQ